LALYGKNGERWVCWRDSYLDSIYILSRLCNELRRLGVMTTITHQITYGSPVPLKSSNNPGHLLPSSTNVLLRVTYCPSSSCPDADSPHRQP
jgi:hypothetical protein